MTLADRIFEYGGFVCKIRRAGCVSRLCWQDEGAECYGF